MNEHPMSSSSHAIAAAILLGSCVQSSALPPDAPDDEPQDSVVWWAPELELDSVESIPRRLERPFAEPFEVVAMADGQLRSATAPSCSTALVLASQGYLPMSDVDAAAFKLEAAKCQVFEWLISAKPTRIGSLANFRLDAESLSVLPPALGPEPNPQDIQDREGATKAGKSWRELDPDARVTPKDPGHVAVRGVDWSTEVDLLARGDFDADGRDDIVLRTLSSGTEGSWREVRLHQLTVDDGKPVLRVSKQVRW